MTTTLSIITPSMNQGEYIERAIESVVRQGLPGVEYVVVDGGSNDATLSVLKRYDKGITWISESDSGPAEAINKGFRMTSGDILGWLNADDIYCGEAFSCVIDVFAKNPSVDVVYGDAVYIDDNEKEIGFYHTEDWNWERMQQTCIISQPATFFRRRVFEQFGPLNETLRIMDYEFWLRLGLAGVQFQHLPVKIAGMRRHPQAFSVAQRLELHRQSNDVTRDLLGRTPSSWLTGWACAYVESKRVAPGTLLHAALGKIILPLYASLYWNKKIEMELFKNIVRNCIAALSKRSIVPNKKS